jgi:type IV secretion system protein VirB6
MVWGYLQLTGRIEEPFVTGLKRLVTLAVVLGVALQLWLYNSVIVDTFYKAPTQLAAAIVGTADPVTTIDAIWNSGGAVAGYLFSNGGLVSDYGYYVAGMVVWFLVGLLCVYTMFLIALSSIALSVLLALGPLFFAALFFDSTRRLFDSWIAQLTNYALITILTVLVATLLLQIVASYASQTAARGSGVATVDSLNMVLVAVLVFLVMRQVMPIASGLASGVSLNSFGTVSRLVLWSVRLGRA